MQNIPALPAGFRDHAEQASEWQYSETAENLFPYRAPAAYINKIDPHDPADPLLRQILPVAAEHENRPGYSPDPLREQSQQPEPGVLHKYHGRALLVVTGACAIHCRYCFRRHFPYKDSNPSPKKWQRAINYLKNDASITEVILSGGDPLTLSDQRLSGLLQLLAEIPHLQRVRIHSRIPVVMPERISNNFIELLAQYPLPIIMVVHANHARELDDTVADVARKIRSTGTLLLNQSVLLRDINANVTALYSLSVRLFELGILPYYLHMLDPVTGTGHFAVPEEEAREIMQNLSSILPGYLVPKLVREIAGASSKVPVTF